MADSLKDSFVKFNWHSDNDVFVAGYSWIDGNYISGKLFLKMISENSKEFGRFSQFSKKLNGQFAIVVYRNNEKWVVCSHTWSYPVFYRFKNRQVFLSDKPDELLDKSVKPDTEQFSKLYFLNFGVTPGSSTLDQNIFQVLPGELIIFHDGKKESYRIYPPFTDSVSAETVPADSADLHKLLKKLFEKYSVYLKDKQVLLPLTRGYDSRLLACLLKEAGHKNVICATWGRTDSDERKTAEKVAGKLGFRYVFIDYSKEVAEDFPLSEQFKDYIRYSAHLSSMPFLQDYFAVNTLKSERIIDEDTVVLPGHPGDLLRGSHLDTRMSNGDIKYMISKIISGFGSSYPFTSEEKKQIREFIHGAFFSNDMLSEYQKFNIWDYQERQCKFIGNSALVFSFFGMEHLMPLFDTDLFHFFGKVPFEQKTGARLYNQTLENRFFKKHDVAFDLKAYNSTGFIFKPVKEKIIRMLPGFLKKLYYPMKDKIFYREITAILKESENSFFFKRPYKPNDYNSCIKQWYMQLLEKTEK